jgi:hypothetical protein
MRSQELNQVVADASPITDADLARFDLEAAGAELLREIVKSSASQADVDLTNGREPDARRRATRGRVVAAVATAAVVIAAVTFVGIGSIGGDERPAFAAEAIKVAEANPRLLVSAPGWSVTRADEFTTDQGEMIFSDGQNELELFWNPADQYKGYLRDRTADSSAESEIEFLGQPATMFRYDDTSTGSPDFTTLIPPQGKSFLEVRGDALGSEDAYLELLYSLQPTDVDTWLAAMPASVVSPTDRAATVDEMLEGIPLPPGFDVHGLKRGDIVSDRYQLGAQVTGAVACEWLDRWTAGTKAGDSAKVRQAKEALATARDWPILLEMHRDGGGYPESIWNWAEDRRGDSGRGRNTTRNYNPELGCRYR